jgi:excisionase family DNA binding protein
MQLTIEEAAARLGKSPRQVRYLIQSKRLPARKFAGSWVIESENLPLSEGQTRALERRERQLRSAVEQALELPADGDRPLRYSVRDLKAFQLALPVYQKASQILGNDHPATAALRRVLEHLARGCHRYDRADKATAYREARDAASLAVCELVLQGRAEAVELVAAIEQELMSALAGLLRRIEPRRPR